MKKEGNMILQKINNHWVSDLNDNEVDKISNNELKRMMIRMINEIKEDMYK
jgi:hypothetical protein